MKYYSDMLDKFFDTYDECILAEKMKKQEHESKEEISPKESPEKVALSKERKALAKDIEGAENALDAEYAKYNDAKKQVYELRKETEKQCDEIMKKAREGLKLAYDNKLAAVQKFNDKFGPYTVSYTGEKAIAEMRRSIDWMNTVFKPFMNLFPW